ncbi:hypothetical protein [Zavarzinia sp.]|uniref:hypothetical protein n=1 Tax=Zavarzinia sp. TaxID=2027920 RepID=UPI003565607D
MSPVAVTRPATEAAAPAATPAAAQPAVVVPLRKRETRLVQAASTGVSGACTGMVVFADELPR